MSKYQALKEALAYAKQTGGIGLTASVADLDALLADLERAEKVLAVIAQQAQKPVAVAVAGASLLRQPVSNISEISKTIPGGCYCPPGICQAPIIMGRQTPCMRRDTTPPAPQPAPVDESPDLNPEDFVVAVVFKQLGGFAPVTAHGVRVTHKPSRVSVVVDSERSQHRNRQLALEALRAILALRPAVEPMTPEQMKDVVWGYVEDSGNIEEKIVFIIRAVETHHGITAKAENAHQPTKEAEKP